MINNFDNYLVFDPKSNFNGTNPYEDITWTDRYYEHYDKSAVDNFISGLTFETDVKGKKLYLQHKGVSQDKLREAGFTITRDPKKADVIVINEFNLNEVYYQKVDCYKFYCSDNIDIYFQFLINNQSSKFCYVKDIYKCIYKYEGNLELFNSLNELLNSKDTGNTQLAMEMMTNANWENNQLYLVELFNLYWNYNNGTYNPASIRSNNYRNSISFKGFLNSLTFPHESLNLNNSDDYREYCQCEEHHQFIYNKFKDDFELELKYLFKKHKIKLEDIKYSIDYDKSSE